VGFIKPPPSDPVVEVSRAVKSYGTTRALDGVDLSVKTGHLFGIIGPNGAGKSTLMRSFFGSVRLDDGRVRVMGLNPASEHLRIKAFAGIVPESETPPSFLRTDEFLDFVMQVRGLKPDRTLNDRWVRFFEMERNRENIAKDLSKGTRQKLMLSSAFIHEPDLFLLDEPFINLDPIFQKKVKDLLMEYVEGGRTVVISTHILSLARELCDTIAVMNEGKVLYLGRTEDLISRWGDLEKAFLELVGYSPQR